MDSLKYFGAYNFSIDFVYDNSIVNSVVKLLIEKFVWCFQIKLIAVWILPEQSHT
jgi:hypothetical protein